MRRSVGSSPAAANTPAVANQSLNRIKFSLVHFPSLVHFWPAHDQVQNTVVFRRLSQVVQRRFQFLHRQMFHGRLHG
jgi:hypothetical protein